MVFVAIKSVQSGAAGFAGDVAGFDAVADFGQDVDELLTLGVGGEDIFVIGRHVAVLDLVDDVYEELMFFKGVIDAVEIVQGDAAFLFLISVAGETVLLEDGLGLGREVVGPGQKGKRKQAGKLRKQTH